MTIDHLLAKARPRLIEARILFDGELLAEHDRLVDALHREKGTDEGLVSRATSLARDIDALEERIYEAEDVFTFGPVPHGSAGWMQLIAAHPAPEEDARNGYEYDRRSFFLSAIPMSAVDPKLTDADAQALHETLVMSEWVKLCDACALANAGEDARPKSLIASAVLHLNAGSTTTPPDEASLAGRSSVDVAAP